jgi:hypothetical protein
MTNLNELGQSRLDSLYIIADAIFDTKIAAIEDLEDLLGLSGNEEKQKFSDINLNIENN